jgi:hypothetical protein
METNNWTGVNDAWWLCRNHGSCMGFIGAEWLCARFSTRTSIVPVTFISPMLYVHIHLSAIAAILP